MNHRIMWRSLATLFLCWVRFDATAQDLRKPPLDQQSYEKWKRAIGGSISGDGKYIMYQIDSGEYKWGANRMLHVVSTANPSKRFVLSGYLEKFTADSRFVSYKKGEDSLGVLDLKTGKEQFVTGVSESVLYECKGRSWLIYGLKGAAAQRKVWALSSGRRQTYENIDHLYEQNGEVVLGRGTEDEMELQYFDVGTGRRTSFYKGPAIGKLSFSKDKKQLAFEVKRKKRTDIWLALNGQQAACLTCSGNIQQDIGIFISTLERFSNDGKLLFVQVQRNAPALPVYEKVKGLDIWSYNDRKLQSEQLYDLEKGRGERSYTGALNLTTKSLHQLQQPFDDFLLPFQYSNDDTINEDYSLALYKRGHERWDIDGKAIPYLVFNKTGERRKLPSFEPHYANRYSLSPGGKYLIYWDRDRKGYYTYETATGAIRSTTDQVPNHEWVVDRWDEVEYQRGVACWLEGDQRVILYGAYDLWLADPAGHEPPVNITKGYGRQHRVMFKVLKQGTIPANQPLILTAFNKQTKENGFFRLQLGKNTPPQQLYMGPYLFWHNYRESAGGSEGVPPIKAGNANAYLVQRMGPEESPNYFFTKDFKTYTQISDVQPQKDYNWLTTELHSWETPSGRELQGILYKPQDFDPSRKYPVIFYYYEHMSDGLYSYMRNQPASSKLNIPWYVSNGYLVFTPDFYLVTGRTGESALESVTSAVKHLRQFKFIDTARLGLQGVSFGGFSTNYIVTHSNLFAAAVTGVGASDFLSYYGTVDPREGYIQQINVGEGQYRLRASIWQHPERYLNNSPIFSADKVTTPLMLYHTVVDGAVPPPQAIEMVNALRRLGKKFWLVMYEEGDHGVFGKSIPDYDQRLKQFFGHFLKGEPAPVWIREGIPASRKQFDRGLGMERAVTKDSTARPIDIWHYNDSVLQSAQLYRLKHPDATPRQSLLAQLPPRKEAEMLKPAGFDPARQYPLLVFLTDNLADNADAQQFLANGYLVYKLPASLATGKAGPVMLDSVEYMIRKYKDSAFIHKDRIGIYGHGLSGYYVNYIITKSKSFAAAAESGGMTNLVSHYNELDGKGEDYHYFYDDPKGFFGKSLWELPYSYIYQSPVVQADRIRTPLLMLHNQADMIIPFSQAEELFTGMRRLGKRCWMLQYDGEGHVLTDAACKKDYATRLMQFFNHYLKEHPAPLWMLEGRPAALKGNEERLELDTKGRTPGRGLLDEIF